MTKKVPPMTDAEAKELQSLIPERPDVSGEILKEAIGPLPMFGIIRQQFEGVIEEHKNRIEGAKKQLVDPSYQFLNKGVDPLEFIVGTAKLLGQAELMLDLDTRARAKVKRDKRNKARRDKRQVKG